MRFRVHHLTRYGYPSPARESHNVVRLMPLSDSHQTCLDFRLTVTPPARLFAYDTPAGRVHHFNIRAPHLELSLLAESLVVTHLRDPSASLERDSDGAFYAREGIRQRYIEYLLPTARVPLHPEVDRIAAVAQRQAGPGTASFLIALTRLLHRAFSYVPGSTDVDTPLLRVLEQERGVCQDFAHLMLAICRRQGIPARYISGYLYTGHHHPILPDRQELSFSTESDRDGEAERTELQARLPESGLVSGDAMHAWIECLMPDEQWRGFDPTNNTLVNENYIRVHYGRDYGDVLPARGLYHGPADHTLEVSVRVTPDRNRE